MRRLARRSGRVTKGLVERRGPAEGDVVAASGAGLAPVDLVFLGVQAGVERGVEHRLHQRRVLARGARGRNVHLEDAGIGRDREAEEFGELGGG